MQRATRTWHILAAPYECAREQGEDQVRSIGALVCEVVQRLTRMLRSELLAVHQGSHGSNPLRLPYPCVQSLFVGRYILSVAILRYQSGFCRILPLQDLIPEQDVEHTKQVAYLSYLFLRLVCPTVNDLFIVSLQQQP